MSVRILECTGVETPRFGDAIRCRGLDVASPDDEPLKLRRGRFKSVLGADGALSRGERLSDEVGIDDEILPGAEAADLIVKSAGDGKGGSGVISSSRSSRSSIALSP
jgi:hypothetical protein